VPTITQLSDGRLAVDWGRAGPFLVFTRRQLRELALALHNHRIITLARLNADSRD